MPPTLTTRAALIKPAGLDQYDIGQFNSNADKIDELLGATPCTSGARPSSSLFNGRLAYETDTDAFIVYRTDISNWRYASDPNVANDTARNALTPKHDGLKCYRKDRDWYEVWNGSVWRVVGNQVLKGTTLGGAWTDLSATTEFDLFDMALTAVPVVSGQNLIFHLDLYVNCTSTTSWLFRVRKDSVPGGQVIFNRMFWLGAAGTADTTITCHVPWPCDGTNSNQTFKLSVQRAAGSGLLDIEDPDSAFWITLEDGASTGLWS